jgi:hypothetical protein
MIEVSTERLKQAVESQHGGRAVFVEWVPVKDVVQGKTVWEGLVHVFELEGHPSATRAYVWSCPIEGSDERLFHAVLHLGLIRSPLDAIRAVMAAERRATR